MNVAEWAAFNGDPVGCTVFWVDQGIDTGPIVVTRRVDAAGCRSIDELRARVDESQLALLDEVLRSIVDDGVAPELRQQQPGDGRQFFRMHADLRLMLEHRLRQAQSRCD
jgi:folate-dependent phosphoribosylglycinamide formyltransferase PurN